MARINIGDTALSISATETMKLPPPQINDTAQSFHDHLRRAGQQSPSATSSGQANSSSPPHDAPADDKASDQGQSSSVNSPGHDDPTKAAQDQPPDKSASSDKGNGHGDSTSNSTDANNQVAQPPAAVAQQAVAHQVEPKKVETATEASPSKPAKPVPAQQSPGRGTAKPGSQRATAVHAPASAAAAKTGALAPGAATTVTTKSDASAAGDSAAKATDISTTIVNKLEAAQKGGKIGSGNESSKQQPASRDAGQTNSATTGAQAVQAIEKATSQPGNTSQPGTWGLNGSSKALKQSITGSHAVNAANTVAETPATTVAPADLVASQSAEVSAIVTAATSLPTVDATAGEKPSTTSADVQPAASAQPPSNPTAAIGSQGQPAIAGKFTSGANGETSTGQTGGLNLADRARLVQRVSRAFQNVGANGGQLRIRLSPPELGSVKVDVTVHDGVMSARLETESESTRNLLVNNLPELRERLGEQGIKIDRFDVDVMNQSPGGSPQNSGSRDQNQPQPRSAFQVTEARPALAVAAAEPASRGPVVGTGSLDVLI